MRGRTRYSTSRVRELNNLTGSIHKHGLGVLIIQWECVLRKGLLLERIILYPIGENVRKNTSWRVELELLVLSRYYGTQEMDRERDAQPCVIQQPVQLCTVKLARARFCMR